MKEIKKLAGYLTATKKRRHVATAGAGLGLSGAAIVWMYATFAPKSSSPAMWQAISKQGERLNKVEQVQAGQSSAIEIYRMLLPVFFKPVTNL